MTKKKWELRSRPEEGRASRAGGDCEEWVAGAGNTAPAAAPRRTRGAGPESEET